MIGALPTMLWIATVTMNLQAPMAVSSPAQPSEGLGQVLARFERATLLPLGQARDQAALTIDPVAHHITIQTNAAAQEAIVNRLKSTPFIAFMDHDDEGRLHLWLADWRVEAIEVEASGLQPRQLVIGVRRMPAPLRRRWLGVAGCADSMQGAPTQSPHSPHYLCMLQEDDPAPLPTREGLSDRELALEQLAQLELNGAKPGDFARWRQRRESSLMARQWLALALVHAQRDELELSLAALKALEDFETHRELAGRLGASLLERALLASLGDDQRQRLARLMTSHQRWLKPAAPWGGAVALGLRRAGAPALALPIYDQLLQQAQTKQDTRATHHIAAAYATAAYEAGQVDRAYFVALYLQEDSPKLPLDEAFLKVLGAKDRPCQRPACTPGLLEQRLSPQLPLSFEGWSVRMWAGSPVVMR